jgi:hypothetical protein
MRISVAGGYALSSVATALLTACGGSQPPISAQGAAPQTSAIAIHAERGTSWMLPEAKSEDLLYISNEDDVDVVTYPQGTFVGTLTGFEAPQGLCSNKAGDVFVVDAGGPVLEYAHAGGSPIKKLNVGYFALSCSVDPTTGNLAVTNNYNASVLIFEKAKGSPKRYSDSQMGEGEFCGYDDKGNLFVDGYASGSSFLLVELPKGRGTFRTIKVDKSIRKPGAVQWDGKYLAIGDFGTGTLYRTTSAGKVEGTVTLDSGVYVNQFWIQDSTIIGPIPDGYSGRGKVRFWKYPAGGFPSKTLSKFLEPFGVTVSLATAGS